MSLQMFPLVIMTGRAVKSYKVDRSGPNCTMSATAGRFDSANTAYEPAGTRTTLPESSSSIASYTSGVFIVLADPASIIASHMNLRAASSVGRISDRRLSVYPA